MVRRLKSRWIGVCGCRWWSGPIWLWTQSVYCRWRAFSLRLACAAPFQTRPISLLCRLIPCTTLRQMERCHKKSIRPWSHVYRIYGTFT